MRIIAGFYKNRRVDFKNLNIRPTTNFAKESLFNILNNQYDLEKTCVLDLFAGSGSISYEFISRGCKTVIAVDNNRKCVGFMKSVKDKLKINNLTIQLSSVHSFLRKNNICYDIVFLDPPYNYKQAEYNLILKNIFTKNIMNKNGVVVIEHSRLINFEEHSMFLNTKKYGRVHFTFFKR
tara:strand:+ start:1541 stop:2077 length:537 start_codon:yes stop_codon:yes gene_type:complete